MSASPLGLGVLSGKYDERNLPDGPRGLIFRALLPSCRPLLATLREVAAARQVSVSAVAINWAMSKGAVVIVGMKTPAQVESQCCGTPLRHASAMEFACSQQMPSTSAVRSENVAIVHSSLSRLWWPPSPSSCAEPRAEWLRWQPGLLPGLNHAVRATCTAEAHAVAIATPIYPPFLAAPVNNDARRLLVPLRAEVADGGALRHELDLGALEDALALPSTRLLMWCQPHNPSGRCWSAEEMAEVARLCVQHDVVLLSDEVWGEMPLEPEAVPFVSALSLLDDVEGLRDKLIVLTSPSKCFNIATTNIATAIIPNASLRRRFAACGRSDGAN